MTTMRSQHDKNNPYFIQNRTGPQDPRISFKAKGILSYIMSRPDHWQVWENDLANYTTEGLTSIRSGMKELRDAGYINKVSVRDESGKITGWETVILESPDTDVAETHIVENPPSGNATFWETDDIESNDLLESKNNNNNGHRLEQNQQPASEPTLDPDYATVVKAYEQNIGMLTPMLSEVLHDMVTEYPVDWIVEAVEIACTANVRKLNYVKAVCENWSRDGRGPKDGVAEPGKKQVVDVPEGF